MKRWNDPRRRHVALGCALVGGGAFVLIALLAQLSYWADAHHELIVEWWHIALNQPWWVYLPVVLILCAAIGYAWAEDGPEDDPE